MIAKEQDIALLLVGKAAAKHAEWTDYASFCFDREKGLRKESFLHLDRFLKSAANWTLLQKIDFVKFLFPLFETIEEADHGPFPQPLNDRLVRPTLEKWCETEELNGDPFRWYGKYYRSEEHLFRAIAINPSDDLARHTLITWWMDSIYYSLHHLPEGYLGEPVADIEQGKKIKEQIDLLTDPELRAYWTEKLNDDLKIVNNYIEWKSSGNADFEQWGRENGRQTGYNQGGTYYFES